MRINVIKIANGILLYVKQDSPSVDENTHVQYTHAYTHTRTELQIHVCNTSTTQQPQTDQENNPGISDN